ncbi:hypothetical protein A2U01_0053695, partial [Trifolium medium]|nr:hypothetical protein [Trifolium medium]
MITKQLVAQGKGHMNYAYGAHPCLTPNQAFPQDQKSENHFESFEDTLILAMQLTQGNFEVMKANQEMSSKQHEASIKNLENQMGQLSKHISSLQAHEGFSGNTTINPRNESCNAINLRSREVSSPVVVEKPCKKKVASE